MSATNGAMGAVPVQPDLTKEHEGTIQTIAAGAAAVAGVHNPAQPQQSLTAFNASQNWVRGTITFSGGITSLGSAATRVFLVPPFGTYTYDSSDVGGDADNATGAINAIDSVSVIAVAVPTAAGVVEASTLAAAASTFAGHVAINFGTA